MDYPARVDGQFQGRTSTAQLPHDGFDPVVPGEKKQLKQGSTDKHVEAGAEKGVKGKKYGEFRTVKQGSTDVRSSPDIREDTANPTPDEIIAYRQRHEGKPPDKIRRLLRNPKLKLWQANQLRMLKTT